MTLESGVRFLAIQSAFAFVVVGLSVLFWVQAAKRDAAPRLRKAAVIIASLALAYGFLTTVAKPYATPWVGWWFAAVSGLYVGGAYYLFITAVATGFVWLLRQVRRAFRRRPQPSELP